ncbi:DUF2231 domain-containing protein [Agromyces sp. M3QZ16-3]|uniref:DUF2231 domain-containing protein n=1 Tax=Agromyces sp. M3QZ16-3 TaxID=3447585 RepID=UPI003F68BC4B
MDDISELIGLPLHPLLVHAVVVLVPLTALALLLGQWWPAARRRLGIVTPLAALAVAVLVPLTVQAGAALLARLGPLSGTAQHEQFGRAVPVWTTAMFVVAAAQWAWFRFAVPALPERRGPRLAGSITLGVAVAVVGTGSVVAVVLAGDSGARAVWSGLFG